MTSIHGCNTEGAGFARIVRAVVISLNFSGLNQTASQNRGAQHLVEISGRSLVAVILGGNGELGNRTVGNVVGDGNAKCAGHKLFSTLSQRRQ